MEESSDFIPLRPVPPDNYPNPFSLLLKARNDLIGFWTKEAYETDFFGGKIVNKWMFIANSPETVEHVFVKNNAIYERKSAFMRKALEPLLGDGLFISDGDVWQTRRAMQAPAFSSGYLRKFSNIMSDCAIEWTQRWQRDYPNREVAILPEMASLTAEILSRSLFGNDLGHENAEKIVRGFSNYQACIKQLDLTSFFGLPEWLPKLPQERRAIKMAGQIHTVVDSIIDKQLQNTTQESTLLSMLLKGYDPADENSITLEQVRNEAVVLLMAGHETTANSLSWAWYLLATHPEVLKKLHAELKHVLGDRPPTFDDVPNLSYTRAIFEEALRLYPPVPVLSREAMAYDRLEDHDILPGSVMLVIPWLLHRHPSYWEKPNHFIPERFMREWPHKHQKYAYIPFSAGPRICLGAAFGLTEAILCLATLSQKFNLSLNPKRVVDYECRLTLRPKNGLPMIVSPRD